MMMMPQHTRPSSFGGTETISNTGWWGMGDGWIVGGEASPRRVPFQLQAFGSASFASLPAHTTESVGEVDHPRREWPDGIGSHAAVFCVPQPIHQKAWGGQKAKKRWGWQGQREHGLCLRIKIWTCATLTCLSAWPGRLTGARPATHCHSLTGPYQCCFSCKMWGKKAVCWKHAWWSEDAVEAAALSFEGVKHISFTEKK